MRFLCVLFLIIVGTFSHSQDTTFWDYARDLEINEGITVKRSWGSERVTYIGTIEWTSPSGKILQIKVVTTYRQIKQANGFNDQSVIALLKTNHELIKTYDMVKRQNLPVKISEGYLIYNLNGLEVASELPDKFSERFCVDGLTCFAQIEL